MNPFKSYLIILAVLSAMFGWGMWERSGKLSIKSEYNGFVADAKAIAAVQLAERQRKEKENEERIKTSESDRNAALASLRLATADSGRLRTTINSLTTSRSGQVCFRSPEFATTLSGITGLVEQGETSLINSRALLEGWPK